MRVRGSENSLTEMAEWEVIIPQVGWCELTQNYTFLYIFEKNNVAGKYVNNFIGKLLSIERLDN